MLDLYESNPTYFEKLKLNLPEANNNIPDIVDEALWCTGFVSAHPAARWRRAERGEAIEHPSEPGWLVGQPTATNAAHAASQLAVCRRCGADEHRAGKV
jgi:hypothetical protein